MDRFRREKSEYSTCVLYEDQLTHQPHRWKIGLCDSSAIVAILLFPSDSIQSTGIYQGIAGHNFQINCVSSPKIDFVLAKSVDPDEMSQYAIFHLGLH